MPRTTEVVGFGLPAALRLAQAGRIWPCISRDVMRRRASGAFPIGSEDIRAEREVKQTQQGFPSDDWRREALPSASELALSLSKGRFSAGCQ